MKSSAAVLVVIGLSLCGCGAKAVGAASVRAPAPAASPLSGDQAKTAPMFLFLWQERLPSKLMHPLGFLMVDQDGSALYLFTPSRGIWKRAAFVISKETLGELRGLTAQSGFLGLGRVEQDTRAAGGGVVYVAVQAGESRKTVWCAGKFPETVVKITTFVKEEILASHQAALAQAEQCTEGEVSLLDHLAVSLRY
jgi:hypothetical protein